MIKPKIMVTGATGKTGSAVATQLLTAGYPVRAMVHREDSRSARLKAEGAEPGSEIWRREHAISEVAKPALPGRDKAAPATTNHAPSLKFQ